MDLFADRIGAWPKQMSNSFTDNSHQLLTIGWRQQSSCFQWNSQGIPVSGADEAKIRDRDLSCCLWQVSIAKPANPRLSPERRLVCDADGTNSRYHSQARQRLVDEPSAVGIP